jgi:hypothetical protein
MSVARRFLKGMTSLVDGLLSDGIYAREVERLE